MATDPPNLKVLAINSFAVHGTASLKAITKILGSRVLPVPSVILNGLTNMHGVSKYETPFKELLQGTLDLAVYRNQKLILYIGYLGKAEQVDILIQLIKTYAKHIHFIITDPICGDHGKAYVPQEIISKLPELIKISDMVFPNITEVKLILGQPSAETEDNYNDIRLFMERFPNVDLAVTSIKKQDEEIGIQFYGKDKLYAYYHPLLKRNFGGSGDTYVALFILYRFYKSFTVENALQKAANLTYRFIQRSINQDSDELVIE